MAVPRLALLAAALAAPCALAQAPQLAAEPTEAQQAIAWAADLVDRGAYEEALQAYRDAAKKFADTPEGELAARRCAPNSLLGWGELVVHGPSANRVDIVLCGDGYVPNHLSAFAQIASGIPPCFERQRVFREYWSYLNFHIAHVVSTEDGIDFRDRLYDTALNTSIVDAPDEHATVDHARVREVLSEIPAFEGLAIVQSRQVAHGDGYDGIATLGAISVTHLLEYWGRAFAGLDDESPHVSYPTVRPTSSPNVSTTDDPALVPWAHWIAARSPEVGIHEGASGTQRGRWKPVAKHCAMDPRKPGEFCPVCREALVLRIHQVVDPIDACTPAAMPLSPWVGLALEPEGELAFEVRMLRPASRPLEARWYVVTAAEGLRTGDPTREAPRTASPGAAGIASRASSLPPAFALKPPPARVYGDRRDRGVLTPMYDEPRQVDRYQRDDVSQFVLEHKSLAPGRYRVVCRVVDDGWPVGERRRWVLRDPHGLLESERGWWVEVK